MNKLVTTLVFFILCVPSLLANPSTSKVADNLWETGNIYVVVAVVVTIFLGILFFLFFLERKIAKLEKEVS